MKRISPYSQQKTTYIKIITILLTISLIVMLFGCGKNNGTDGQGSSAGGSSSASGNQVIWNAAFKNLFHTDAETETKFADLVHDVNQTEGAVTLLQTLNNGKVIYLAFELDSMADDIPDPFKGGSLYVQDYLFIRGDHPTEDIVGLSKEEIKEQYKGQIFLSNGSLRTTESENGKSVSLIGTRIPFGSDNSFSGDMTFVITGIECSKEDGSSERANQTNYVFHFTETPSRSAIKQPIIQDGQTIGSFMLTEMTLQVSILYPEKVEDLASALPAQVNEFTNPRIKLLDKNNQEIVCTIIPNGGSVGSSIQWEFTFGNLVDTSEVSGIQVGGSVIIIDPSGSGAEVKLSDDIYFVGKDAIVTRTELEEAKDFYLQAGYSEEDAFDQAVLYVQTYETMYFLATKAGYQATEKEIEDRIELLGGSAPTIEKDIAIEKYREAEIKTEFDKIATHKPGSEEYWVEWAEWYANYQSKMVEEQGFQLASALLD